jgi:hypothetical protein
MFSCFLVLALTCRKFHRAFHADLWIFGIFHIFVLLRAMGGAPSSPEPYREVNYNRESKYREATSDEFIVVPQSDGNMIVYFTKAYTEQVLNGNWYPCPGNPNVPPRFAEAIKKEGGSYSWDLRLEYEQKQKHGNRSHQAPPTPAGPREATSDEFIVVPQSDGNMIVYFTKAYTEQVLNGNWYPCPGNPNVPPRFGEAIKKEGGSYSWDLRLEYEQKQKHPLQILMSLCTMVIPFPILQMRRVPRCIIIVLLQM